MPRSPTAASWTSGISNAAGSATILNNADLWFRNTSTAGSATVTTGSGGLTHMQSTATLGAARFITQAGGTLDISGLSSAGTTAGSIEGAGDHVLGDKNLEVGSNGLSTEVSGAISGAGGSLTKTGSGTLTLSGTNAYTGATVVDAGTLAVNSALTATSGITVNAGGRSAAPARWAAPASTAARWLPATPSARSRCTAIWPSRPAPPMKWNSRAPAPTART